MIVALLLLGSHAIAEEPDVFAIKGGPYSFSLRTSETPSLAQWARSELVPTVEKWYPIIVQLLPSEGYAAPERFSIVFRSDMEGVAFTSGHRIEGAEKWYSRNLQGEAIGSIIHELVHVVQQYPARSHPPGWLVEGIADYVRFYLFEPQTHGADIPPQRAGTARYDASYRTSANFLQWVTGKYSPDLVPKLNRALRNGSYTEALWQEIAGHPLADLAGEWQAALTNRQ